MARPSRKPPRSPRVPRIRPSIWDVLDNPEAHPERHRRMGDNLFLAFALMWVFLIGSWVIIWLMRHR